MRRFFIIGAAAVAMWTTAGSAQNLPWNNPGGQTTAPATSAPAPKRDINGIWDAGGGGIGARGMQTSPLTPAGDALGKTHHSGDGARMVPADQINDPLSTMGDPGGFPRMLLFELRPFEAVQMPNKVLMFYMFEKRWRVIWTDGRALPNNPDPRWYGYSVGRWEDDDTFVVNTIGSDERTWLDNAGNPHSADLKVEERYHRVNRDLMELTVTIDDPKTYTRTWTPRNRMPLTLAPAGFDMMEMICSPTEVMEFRKNISDRSNTAR